MSPHLRFNVRSAALAAGVLLSFASCSTSKIAPLAPDPEHEITYEVQIFDLPADHSFGSQPFEILSAGQGAKLLKQISLTPAFSATTGARLGKKKTLSNRKDFVYPGAYDPPKVSKKSDNTTFPVTPATPKDFLTTQLGSTVSLSGSKFRSGKIALDYEIERKILLRHVNYGDPILADATDFWGRAVKVVITENRMEKPEFWESIITSTVEFAAGDYLVVRSSPVSRKETERPTTEYRSGSFIALIRLATSKP
jgi:hypothetical protein